MVFTDTKDTSDSPLLLRFNNLQKECYTNVAIPIASLGILKYQEADRAWTMVVKPILDTKLDYCQAQYNRMLILLAEYFIQKGESIPEFAFNVAMGEA